MKANKPNEKEQLFIKTVKHAEQQQKKEHYQKAALTWLEASRLLFGEEYKYPEEFAICLHNIGKCYFSAEDYYKAEYYFQMAFNFSSKMLGEEDIHTVSILGNMGNVFLKKDNFEKAEESYKKVLSIFRKNLGDYHPDTINVLNNLDYLEKLKQQTQENLKNKAALHQANKLAYLGQMATMMAHNINNPVGIIALKATSALSDLKENLFDANTELEPLLNGIIEQTKRLNLMTGNIRQFARSEKIQLSPVNVNELINNTYSLLFVAPYQNDNIQFIRNFIEPTPMAHANEFALQEILVSLLSNAKDALKNKTLKTVTITTWQTEKNVGFTIEDNGDGVAPEQVDNLFTPFRSSKDEGMGLGLYFCKEICKELNGIIEYYPIKQGGTAFKITLQPERIKHEP